MILYGYPDRTKGILVGYISTRNKRALLAWQPNML